MLNFIFTFQEMTDVFSWGDSDPFEEDDSWMSEPESVCNNWRGWKKCSNSNTNNNVINGGSGGQFVASTSGLGIGYNNNSGVNGVPLPSNLQSTSSNTAAGSGLIFTSLTTTVLGSCPNSTNPHRPSSPTYAILNSLYRG